MDSNRAMLRYHCPFTMQHSIFEDICMHSHLWEREQRSMLPGDWQMNDLCARFIEQLCAREKIGCPLLCLRRPGPGEHTNTFRFTKAAARDRKQGAKAELITHAARSDTRYTWPSAKAHTTQSSSSLSARTFRESWLTPCLLCSEGFHRCPSSRFSRSLSLSFDHVPSVRSL